MQTLSKQQPNFITIAKATFNILSANLYILSLSPPTPPTPPPLPQHNSMKSSQEGSTTPPHLTQQAVVSNIINLVSHEISLTHALGETCNFSHLKKPKPKLSLTLLDFTSYSKESLSVTYSSIQFLQFSLESAPPWLLSLPFHRNHSPRSLTSSSPLNLLINFRLASYLTHLQHLTRWVTTASLSVQSITTYTFLSVPQSALLTLWDQERPQTTLLTPLVASILLMTLNNSSMLMTPNLPFES